MHALQLHLISKVNKFIEDFLVDFLIDYLLWTEKINSSLISLGILRCLML